MVEQQARDEIIILREQVKAAETERYADADELEDLRRERDALRRSIRAVTQYTRPAALNLRVDPHDLDIPVSIGDAIDLAAIWQGLLALNEYAETKSIGQQPPGFKLWCEETGSWPVSKLAMTESETVLNNDQLRNQRRFPVSSDVQQSGRVHMYSHLKIQAGGGDNIPRLYFHDDTDGSTGRMHIGFIGPHRHVRNTKS